MGATNKFDLIKSHEGCVDHAVLVSHDLALVKSVCFNHCVVEFILAFSIDVSLIDWIESTDMQLSEFIEHLLVSLNDHDLIFDVGWHGDSQLTEVISLEEEKTVGSQVCQELCIQTIGF